jgi:hypothetical protein
MSPCTKMNFENSNIVCYCLESPDLSQGQFSKFKSPPITPLHLLRTYVRRRKRGQEAKENLTKEDFARVQVVAEVEKARNGKVGALPAGLFGRKESIL